MKKKLFLVSTLIISSLFLISCTSNKNLATDTSSESNDISESTEESSPAADNKSKSEEKDDTKVAEKKVSLYIYTEDANSMELQQSKAIEINENASLSDKLKYLADGISKNNFDSLPIEVKSIDKVGDKTIATINLKDPSNKKNAWYQMLQGSTGGQITSDTLIETFIQTKYKGEWIDGVTFLMNGAKIEAEHAPTLSDTVYRN
ncbi:hypothetical protein [Clostridium sp. BJN0001]|uniref:hypothetical protein n=1 Tax=Clostridium sp. BJN0001 TaxID=2930219 RepID=UPI001FD1FC89|nr:hypothetical protein [Clostridium sp. BJN0001]